MHDANANVVIKLKALHLNPLFGIIKQRQLLTLMITINFTEGNSHHNNYTCELLLSCNNLTVAVVLVLIASFLFLTFSPPSPPSLTILS